jgi:regulator of RNase E activity RraA
MKAQRYLQTYYAQRADHRGNHARRSSGSSGIRQAEALAEVQPGEVLVLTMPEPRPVALVGELLATQAKAHGPAAILVDASSA